MKRILFMVLLSGLFIILPQKKVQAEWINIYDLDSVTYSIPDEGDDFCCFINKGNGSEMIKSVISSDPSIASGSVSYLGDGINITGYWKGSCTLTVTTKDNFKKAIKVIVPNSCCGDFLEYGTWLDGLCHGSRKLEIRTLPNTTGVMKIRKDTYSFSSNAYGKVNKIKLKRAYNYNEKVKITLKKDGVVYTKKVNVEPSTYSYEIEGAKKKIKVRVYNLHKGDIVKVKHRGKTYTKKIKKNYKHKYKWLTFKTKKKVKEYGYLNSTGDSIKVTIYNKKKVKLYSHHYTLHDGYSNNGEWDTSDDD